MRNIYYIFILIIIASCVGEPFDNGQQHPNTSTHNYPSENGQSTINSDPNLTNVEISNEESNRFTWQKPKEVIRRLGEGLPEKTVADIGAGPHGYFTFQFVKYAKKVIAIDINKEAVSYMDSVKFVLREEYKDKIETRLVPDNDPKLKDGEADIVFISNTFSYIENPTEYLKKVKDGMPIGGQICIVDYKMRKIPSVFPSINNRFQHLISYDDVLDYQYIVIAEKVK